MHTCTCSGLQGCRCVHVHVWVFTEFRGKGRKPTGSLPYPEIVSLSGVGVPADRSQNVSLARHGRSRPQLPLSARVDHTDVSRSKQWGRNTYYMYPHSETLIWVSDVPGRSVPLPVEHHPLNSHIFQRASESKAQPNCKRISSGR